MQLKCLPCRRYFQKIDRNWIEAVPAKFRQGKFYISTVVGWRQTG